MRLRLSPRFRIGSEADELVFAEGAEGAARVVLRSIGDEGPPIRDADWLVLRGEGYLTSGEAEEAASRWSSRLRIAFAGSLLGADFGGPRGPQSHITPAGLQAIQGMLSGQGGVAARLVGRVCGPAGRALQAAAGASNTAAGQLLGRARRERQRGRRILEDVHGTQVFECLPDPLFAKWDLDILVHRSCERLTGLMAEVEAKNVSWSEREELAFDLFSGSFFDPTADGRFLMLMMSVEMLAKQERRADPVVAHIDQLIAATRSSNLSSSDRQSLSSTLEDLKRESIGRACRRLAETLGGRTYLGKSPTAFIRDCYDLRSDLVHGRLPRPTFDQINALAADFERFVSDLLIVPHGLPASVDTTPGG